MLMHVGKQLGYTEGEAVNTGCSALANLEACCVEAD